MGKKVQSPEIVCDGDHPVKLPKYVFVLSLENRSFDHLFGRYRNDGVDAANRGSRTKVNGVLGSNGKPNPECNNVFKGTTYGVPEVDAAWLMPGDPKHEYEHILCQVNGQKKAAALYDHFNLMPAGLKADDMPIPPQSDPNNTPASSFSRGSPDCSGFVASWVNSYTDNNTEHAEDKTRGTPKNVDEVMRCFDTPRQLPVLNSLAKEFVLCDNFYSSLPGPTGPNRFFMMAGSSAGYDHSPSTDELTAWQATGRTKNTMHLPLANGNVFTWLDSKKVSWGVYGDDNFPMAAVLEGVHTILCERIWPSGPSILGGVIQGFRNLQTRLSTGMVPSFNWIEPDFYTVAASAGGSYFFKHPTYSMGNSMHPCSDVRLAEKLIADVYNLIRGSRYWNESVLFITWDEHGGFYDHVKPPGATPPGDPFAAAGAGNPPNEWGYDFSSLGIRVPCIIASPLIDKNLIDHRQYDHTSILKTVRDLYNAGAFDGQPKTGSDQLGQMTARDGAAPSLFSLFNRCAPRTDVGPIAQPIPQGQDAPPENSAAAAASQAAQPVNGNMAIFLVSAMAQHKDVDPSFDPVARMAQIKTMGDAQRYMVEATRVIEPAKKAPPLPVA
jgi:phospholipase C